ncbi:MAG: hypothetical protein Aureis2KO_23970 [Aureisphaera sp.]
MKLLFHISLLAVLVSCNSQPELLFEDQFEGNSLNEEIWNYELGDGCPNLCGWGNNERQVYNKKNLRLENGFLKISATYQDSIYNSSRITTKDKLEFQYGTVEVRAQLPQGHGLWPAIWMLGNDIDTNNWPKCGEIDIMEYVGREPGVIYTSLHTPASFGNTINSQKTELPGVEVGFHTYKINWTVEAIDFYIDDAHVYHFSPQEKNDETWPYDKPFYMLMNMAIGGNFGGPEVDDSIFPQEFVIDYIKIYKP